MKKALFGLIMAMGALPALADQCSTTVEANDAMQYNTKAIQVPASCKDFTVTLKHTGQLPKTTMGHNWVLSKTADYQQVAAAGGQAGIENNYLPQGDDRVLAHTAIIGGGESTSVTIDLSTLQKGDDYTFYCSFPGHFAIMNGKFVVQ